MYDYDYDGVLGTFVVDYDAEDEVYSDFTEEYCGEPDCCYCGTCSCSDEDYYDPEFAELEEDES